MQQRADPNTRVRSNRRTPNEALVVRLRRQGIQAQLSHGQDGEFEVTRPCVDCGASIFVTKLGRPRERCDPCRERRHGEAVSAWKGSHREHGAAWRAAHPTYQRDYAREHPEKIREYGRKYDSEHRDDVNARARRWRAAHRDEANEQLRRRRAEHPGQHAADMRQWRATHAKPPESGG